MVEGGPVGGGGGEEERGVTEDGSLTGRDRISWVHRSSTVVSPPARRALPEQSPWDLPRTPTRALLP